MSPLQNDGATYDFAMVLPAAGAKYDLLDRFRSGILDYFGLDTKRERRTMNVYVLSGPVRNCLGLQALSEQESGLRMGSLGAYTEQSAPFRALPSTVTLDSITSVSVDGSIDDLCGLLEQSLEHPVLNETKLTGSFALRVKVDEKSQARFASCLREHAGLVLSTAIREIEVFVVRKR
jgi:uncharacterized protein (TIGR03435 family)